jgi:hypothetical protein
MQKEELRDGGCSCRIWRLECMEAANGGGPSDDESDDDAIDGGPGVRTAIASSCRPHCRWHSFAL